MRLLVLALLVLAPLALAPPASAEPVCAPGGAVCAGEWRGDTTCPTSPSSGASATGARVGAGGASVLAEGGESCRRFSRHSDSREGVTVLARAGTASVMADWSSVESTFGSGEGITVGASTGTVGAALVWTSQGYYGQSCGISAILDGGTGVHVVGLGCGAGGPPPPPSVEWGYALP